MLYRRCFATVSPSCHSCHLMKISLEKKSIGDITVPERKITKLLSLLKKVVQLAHRVTYVLHGRQCFQGKLFIRHNRNGKGKIQMIDYLNKHFPPCRNCCKARTSKVLLDF